MTGKPKVLFVTGVSCAGKTTLGQGLAELDDVGVWADLDCHAREKPITAWLDWLRWRAATELANVVDMVTNDSYVSSGVSVITGIVWPFRVIESPIWPDAAKTLDVHWLMLDPPWKTLRERLDVRTAGDTKANRRELRRYNRQLRTTLRSQVQVLANGQVCGDKDLSAQAVVDLLA